MFMTLASLKLRYMGSKRFAVVESENGSEVIKQMKKAVVSVLNICLIIVLVFSSVTTTAYAESSIFCSECGKRIPAESKFCMYCGHTVKFLPNSSSAGTWGSWSLWSTTRVYATDTRQVETRTVVTGYNMVHYGTQMDASPHYRMFRNYSIKAHLGDYGARASYGEKHFIRYVTSDMLSSAVQYEPGEFIKGTYAGYQKGTDTAYSFGDDKYVWFIESTVERIEYRYRDLAP